MRIMKSQILRWDVFRWRASSGVYRFVIDDLRSRVVTRWKITRGRLASSFRSFNSALPLPCIAFEISTINQPSCFYRHPDRLLVLAIAPSETVMLSNDKNAHVVTDCITLSLYHLKRSRATGRYLAASFCENVLCSQQASDDSKAPCRETCELRMLMGEQFISV